MTKLPHEIAARKIHTTTSGIPFPNNLPGEGQIITFSGITGEIHWDSSIDGLSGELADPQTPKDHSLGGSAHSSDTLTNLNAKVSDATLDDSGDPRDPNAHSGGHEQGGR